MLSLICPSFTKAYEPILNVVLFLNKFTIISRFYNSVSFFTKDYRPWLMNKTHRIAPKGSHGVPLPQAPGVLR